MPFVRQIVTTTFLVLIGSSLLLWAADVKTDEIVSKHLRFDRLSSGSRHRKVTIVQGAATYRIVVGGSGAIDGRFVFASEGPKSDYLFKVNASGYLGEQFICDGTKSSVAGTYPDKPVPNLESSFSLRTHCYARICSAVSGPQAGHYSMSKPGRQSSTSRDRRKWMDAIFSSFAISQRKALTWTSFYTSIRKRIST